MGRKFKIYLKETAGRGTVVIFATHILSLAQEVCDRIGLLVNGAIVVEGRLDELMALAADRNLEEFYFRIVLNHERPAER